MKATFTSKSSGFNLMFSGRSYTVEVTEDGRIVRTDYKQYSSSGEAHVLFSPFKAKVSPERASAFFEELTRILHSKTRMQCELCDGDMTELELSYEPALRHVEIADGLVADESLRTLWDVVDELLEEAGAGSSISKTLMGTHAAIAERIVKSLPKHVGKTATITELFDLHCQGLAGLQAENVDFDQIDILVHEKAQRCGFCLSFHALREESLTSSDP